ncbi:DUF6127 family protein [Neoroseomonas lacus]|uniref:Uncharacterized protein n=1 Tax=Neoroseomonas lacus TaxID=287609 RepID=A0A917KHY3_9PROT|nr:DUF6127 family protein [Neoroseomonas lacus]GGJ14361.1 hypothetical protein GCM10011320_21970 [Neoroseomonas lacus]
MHDRKQLVMEAQELRAMLDQAAEDGAKRALAAIGLHDSEAANDVRDLRQVMADWRAVKRTMFTSIANTMVLGLMALIGFGVLWHLRKGP